MFKEVNLANRAEVISASQVPKLTEEPLLLFITATFTAEPIAESLGFWLQELNIQGKIEFAPYNQVFQQLLDPASLIYSNPRGINIVLVRLEDWQRQTNSYETETAASDHAKIEQTVKDFVLALKAVAAQTATPNLVCLCPSSPTATSEPQAQAFFNRMEALIMSELAGISGIYLIPSQELIATYPVATYYDPQGDELGHIPYIPLFFAALGTVLVRKIYTIQNPPHKVIVLDCDQTLWQGVCGEDGVMGIKLDPPRKALQDFMVTQYEGGMLICLCSKNNESDVIEVFERRLDMPLKRDYIVSWRLNWNVKSENLKSLASELNLGLDSFIFIDDNPVECAEVNFNCPEVLTLLLAQNPEEIPLFLQHIWAFDRLKITTEDQQRTTLYKQNIQRDRLQKQALTLEEFLVGLGLEIKISQLAPLHLARVAQLTQRTNQFNMTTIRRSEQEIQQLQKEGKLECLVVEVCDRFGDYGLVGVILFATKALALQVDTLLLSCRVLGRGVEHRMLAQLGEIAQSQGKIRVDVPYMPTQKNQPALNFLNSVGIAFKQPLDEGYIFQFPVEYAREVVYSPQAAGSETPSALPETQVVQPQETRVALEEKSSRLSRIASELYSAQQVLNRIESQLRQRPDLLQPFVLPLTQTEQQLAQIWAQLLRLDKVGIHDNFFELGGNSLAAVSLFAQIKKIFGKDITVASLFQAPTVEQLASFLSQSERLEPKSSLVEIQTGGSKRPFFCIINLVGFLDLARLLGPEQPFYGLTLPAINEIQNPYTAIKDIAANCIDELRTVQPEGPYLVGGLCFGSIVAFEIAQQLQAQGHKVALLALFEPKNPFPTNVLSANANRFVYHWRKLLQLAPRERLSYMLEKASRFKANILLPKARALYDYRAKLADDKFALVNSSYIPQLYQGRITLFLPSDTYFRLNPEQDPGLSWSQLAVAGLDVYNVPGDHASLLNEPHIQVLAEKFRACLEQAQADD